MNANGVEEQQKIKRDLAKHAVALAMKIVAQERAGDEDIEAELAEAKAVFDAAPDEARAEAMERLAKASIRAALAREARKRYET